MKKYSIILLLLILGILTVSGCTPQGTQSTTPVEASNVEDTPVETANTISTGEVKEFKIIAKNWEFVPNTIEVNLGDKVKLHIESVDVTHGFRLSEFGINEQLDPHSDVYVDFIADKKGTFTFSCSVPCGSGHGGMRGQLIVK